MSLKTIRMSRKILNDVLQKKEKQRHSTVVLIGRSNNGLLCPLQAPQRPTHRQLDRRRRRQRRGQRRRRPAQRRPPPKPIWERLLRCRRSKWLISPRPFLVSQRAPNVSRSRSPRFVASMDSIGAFFRSQQTAIDFGFWPEKGFQFNWLDSILLSCFIFQSCHSGIRLGNNGKSPKPSNPVALTLRPLRGI